MSDFAKQAQEAAEQYLAAIQKIQDASLEAISRVTSSIPDSAKDAANDVPRLPTPEGLPTVEEVSESYFEFTEKLVANQKAYAERFARSTQYASAGRSQFTERFVNESGAIAGHFSALQSVYQPMPEPSAQSTVPPRHPSRDSGSEANRTILLDALSVVFEELPANEIDDLTDLVGGERSNDNLDAALWGPSPSTSESIRAYVANMKAKYVERRLVLAQSITRAESAQLLGISDQAVSDHLSTGDLVGLKDGRIWKLPIWQFDADTENGWLPGVADLRRYFPAGPVTLTTWVTTPNAELDNRPPTELLAAGDIDQVLLAARAERFAW